MGDNDRRLAAVKIDKGITRVVIGPNSKTVVGREPPPGLLPASGSLRTTPSAAFGGVDVKGNRKPK